MQQGVPVALQLLIVNIVNVKTPLITYGNNNARSRRGISPVRMSDGVPQITTVALQLVAVVIFGHGKVRDDVGLVQFGIIGSSAEHSVGSEGREFWQRPSEDRLVAYVDSASVRIYADTHNFQGVERRLELQQKSVKRNMYTVCFDFQHF